MNREILKREIILIFIVFAGIFCGLLIQNHYQPKFRTYNQNGISFNYPRGWIRDISSQFLTNSKTEVLYDKSVIFKSLDTKSKIPPQLSIEFYLLENFKAEDIILPPVDIIYNKKVKESKESLDNFVLLSTDTIHVGKIIEFMYVKNNRDSIPEVRFVKACFYKLDNQFLYISLECSSNEMVPLEKSFDEIISKIKIDNGGVDA